jgi:ELWxxDGT repeat protein
MEIDMARNLVLFDGRGTGGDYGLWVTDGTVAGSQELTGISGVYTGTGGFDPYNLTVFNGEVLFTGTDAADEMSLWVTNGTAAGTQELTGINGAYTGSGGLQPFGLVVLDTEVLFNGIDAAGDKGLWVTNGTSAGTQELTGISGAHAGGLNPSDLTVFNGKVLFNGVDSSGNNSLWVTDGTAAGTHELTGISGAYTGGIFSSTLPVPLFPDLTIFNDHVLFEGANAAGQYGLWVTNGTAAGTHELTGISGASPHGIFSFVFSPDFTVFNFEVVISLDGSSSSPFSKSEVLFDGTDAAGADSLWVTDGTAAVTYEMTGISGANPGGLFFAVSYPDFTVFNGEVLFVGTDSAGQNGLWVTTGLEGSTYELTGISGASANGIFSVVGDPNFTVFDGEVLFEGTDAAGHRGLWVTDGTAAGTHELTGISGAFKGQSGLSPFDLSADISPMSDFNGDGKSDILFQNVSSGQICEWQMNGTSVGFHGIAGNNSDPTLQAVGTGDFNGDGKSDVVFQNINNGNVYEWQMNGLTVINQGLIGNNTNPNLHVVGTGDFNGDGYSDILLQNVNTGRVWEWQMNGMSVLNSSLVGNNTDPSWHVVGTGDFNGDGKSDILFQNVSTGQVSEWQMNGTSVINSGLIGNNTDPSWHVVATGDFNADGKSDILFQNVNTGQVWEWQMNGMSVINSGAVGNNNNPNWHVVGTGDSNGNGYSEIVFQNVSNGHVMEWDMNGMSLVGSALVGNNTDPNWHVI